MFQSFDNGRKRSGWGVAGTVMMHIGVVAVLVVTPMVFVDSLPANMLQASSMFVPPEVPPGPRIVHTGYDSSKPKPKAPPLDTGFFIPPEIPPKIFNIPDEGGDGIPGNNRVPGVVGGCDGCIGNNPGGPPSFLPPMINVASPPPPPPAPVPPPPPPPPPVIQIQRIGGDVAQANLINQVKPEYPPLARAARVQDYVMLQATISKLGTIEDLKVLRGHPLLNEAAMQAVKQWRYKPQLLNGEAIEVVTTVTVNFTFGQ